MSKTERSEWAITKWSRHQEMIQLGAEINKIEREQNKESMNKGFSPLSILLDKTSHPLLKDRE